METAIAVFTSRDRAEAAVRALRDSGIPDDQMVFLTRSEAEAQKVARSFVPVIGGLVGGATGFSVGAIVATLLLPGVGAVFALGVGGAALLGVAGAGATMECMSPEEKPKAIKTDEQQAQDARFFRKVLQEGRSLIVVRTESPSVAATACGILDRFGMTMQAKTPLQMETVTRESGDVGIVDVRGPIILGEGNVRLRNAIAELLEKGCLKLLLNLAEVSYVDSSGLGELVKALTTVQSRGGQLKISSLNKRLADLLRVTHLESVFDIASDETGALAAFSAKGAVA
jgi:anti-sigma B factor antagonist